MKKPPLHEEMQRLYFAARSLKFVEGQSAVARYMKQSPQTVKNWEERGISAQGKIVAEEVFGCSPAWLSTGEGEMVRSNPDKPTQKMPVNIQSKKQSDSVIDVFPKDARVFLLQLANLERQNKVPDGYWKAAIAFADSFGVFRSEKKTGTKS